MSTPQTTEHHIALREAHSIESSDSYFKHRAHLDDERSRHMFERGFERGFNAGEKVYRAVPSEGIASVAASDQQIDKAARVIAERMDYPWEHMPEKGRDNMRSIARAALVAASDEEKR